MLRISSTSMWFPSENKSVPSIHRMVQTDDLIVANDGVRRIISFPCLHLTAEYGPFRSNSNRLALGVASKLHCTNRTQISPKKGVLWAFWFQAITILFCEMPALP